MSPERYMSKNRRVICSGSGATRLTARQVYRTVAAGFILRKLYRKRKKEISNRLKEFKNLWRYGSEEDIFTELCFCLLTPQSKALSCWDAVSEIKKKGFFSSDCAREISKCLRKKVRFHNNKARYIVAARKFFSKNGRFIIREKLYSHLTPRKWWGDVLKLRDWLVKNIKGLGYKESSHFLRNIGFGENVAILDRHILKNLKALRIIDKIPESLSRKKYLDIEEKMKEFSISSGIPVEALDLLFWSKETGRIFK